MPPHQTLPALLCVALLGCAVGVEDWDSLSDPTLGAPLADASSGVPPQNPGFPSSGPSPIVPPIVITYDSGGAWTSDARVEVVVIDSGTGGWGSPDSSGSGQGATASDSSVGPPSNPQPTTDAGSASVDGGGGTSDAGTSPTPSSDAGSAPKPVDAGYTPPEAGPMCQAATCTNYCGLARRCCNASSQCACMSLLGNCTLPSLRP